jgi:hypothetical protein
MRRLKLVVRCVDQVVISTLKRSKRLGIEQRRKQHGLNSLYDREMKKYESAMELSEKENEMIAVKENF